MSGGGAVPLVVGEIFVDFTVTPPGSENKLRLGGIAHAARGFWANGVAFAAAVVLPRYLEGSARKYFAALGCVAFDVIGYVDGAPNVIAIFDASEVADQGYEDLLRDEKTINSTDVDLSARQHEHILIFPGKYDLIETCARLPGAMLHLDVAYDLPDPAKLRHLKKNVGSILISTSSPLFEAISGNPPAGLASAFSACSPNILILKENRGGSRMFDGAGREIERLPAQLGVTVNSVGVGDVFAATYVAHVRDPAEAGWRATYAAAAYSQTTVPDLFKKYVERDQQLSLEVMKELSGTQLPWEARTQSPIYFAAPDFANADRRAMDEALAALTYHHFTVRRPVAENGELPQDSDMPTLRQTYAADYQLLKDCALVFAVPTGRDPGTLVEIGIAIEAGMPVVVFDQRRENANTMVMAGANHYSADLDSCLNAVFRILGGRKRA